MNHIAGSDVFFVVLHCDNDKAQKIEDSFQKEAFLPKAKKRAKIAKKWKNSPIDCFEKSFVYNC